MSRFSDASDRASFLEEAERSEALRTVRERAAAHPRLRPRGRCYNCEDPTQRPEALFCDPSCRDDYEKRAAARLRNGA